MMARVEVARRRWPVVVRMGAGLLIGLAIAIFVGVAGGAAWLKNAMREQLPVLDGQLALPGLSAPVLVRRDTHGIPHIQAANMDDLLEAQGYVVAQDRLWQMDMSRRFASGELAELLGSSVVEHDKVQRVLQVRPAAEHLASTMTADQWRLFEAFARGVNAFIATHQDNLPAEFRLLHYKPRPWQPVDSWLVALNMVARLDTLYPWKLERAVVESKLPPNLVAELYPTTTWRDHPPTEAIPDLTAPQQDVRQIKSEDESQSSLEDLLHLRGVLGLGSDSCDGCKPGFKPGSNEWAVSGAHTASGEAMMSNDMHLEHSIPDIWHEEELQAGSYHVAGVTTPGIPFIVEGHNEHVSWGFTTLNGDVQDVYVEKTNGQGEYWAGNGWRQPEHDQEHIHVRFGKDVLLDVETTEHGPVITPLLPHESRMLSLKWVLYSSQIHGIPLQAMNTAGNWSEFRQALSQWWGPTQNVAYADDQGHIGYQGVGLVPIRPAGPSGVPVVETGTPADQQHEWTGFVDFNQLPSVADPANGILATANSRITSDGYPYPLALNWAAPYRNERIWKWLAAHDKLTAADMLTLQMDTYSDVDHALAQRFAYAIDRTPNGTQNGDNRLRQAADLLRGWDGVITTHSVAAEIVDSAKQALWPLVLEPKLGDDWKLYDWQNKDFVQEEMVAHGPAEWLPQNYSNWDALLVAAVQQGMAGAPPALSDWTFGSKHVVDVKHPLYGMLPFFGSWTSTGATQLAGDETTVNHVRGLLGASERLTVDWGDGSRATENIVMGESGDPLSPYFLDQWPDWLHGKTFVLPFGDAAVSAATSHTLKLVP